MKSKEAQLQTQMVNWFRYQYPNDIIFAVPNGGSRNPIEAVNLKRQGVVAGVSDLIVIMEKKVVFVEVKIGKNKQTESQKNFQNIVESKGIEYWLIYSLDEFINKMQNI